MSGPSSVSKENVFNRQAPQPGNKDHKNQESVVLLNGLPLKATYLANCRLCLSDQLGKNSVNIMDEQLSVMMNHVFRFPVTFKKALPMTICTKCYKGVELFYRYTYQVLGNQKTLEEALLPDQNLKQSQIDSAAPARVPHRDTNQGNIDVVNIVTHVEKDDNFVEVDMQCEPADEEGIRDTFSQPSNYDTHFVAVPGGSDIFYDMETYGFECIRNPSTKPVEDAPFVIEIISASEDEYEMNAEDEIVTKRNNHQRAHAQQKRNSKVVAKAKHITTLNKPKNSMVGRITLANFATSANWAMDDDISSLDTTNSINKRSSRRNTTRQQHATKPEKRSTR